MEENKFKIMGNKGISAKQKKHKRRPLPDEIHRNCDVFYVEWAGHHKKLERIDCEVYRCTLKIYGQTAHIYKGSDLIAKKRTSSSYFSFTTAQERKRAQHWRRVADRRMAAIQRVREKLKEVLERKRIYVAPYFDNFVRNPVMNRIQPLPDVEVPWIEKSAADVLALFDDAYGRNGYQSSLDYARRTLKEIHAKNGTRIGLRDAVRVCGNRKSVLKMAA